MNRWTLRGDPGVIDSLPPLIDTRRSFFYCLIAIQNKLGRVVMLRLNAEQYQKSPILADKSTCGAKIYIVTGSHSGLGQLRLPACDYHQQA